LTTRREALALVPSSMAGAALPSGFAAGARVDSTAGAPENSMKSILPPERRWLAKLGVGLVGNQPTIRANETNRPGTEGAAMKMHVGALAVRVRGALTELPPYL
jgi:hypothetical protein